MDFNPSTQRHYRRLMYYLYHTRNRMQTPQIKFASMCNNTYAYFKLLFVYLFILVAF
jgi:hypothetical protein